MLFDADHTHELLLEEHDALAEDNDREIATRDRALERADCVGPAA